jgi:hypothetical protein
LVPQLLQITFSLIPMAAHLSDLPINCSAGSCRQEARRLAIGDCRMM